ncbi:hypothetical protein NPM06_33330, partial [Bacillus cereus]|uniref:hypothetical protein n=1 Tax=Bacillus cereus TaxID=1396 RepID=UPI00211364B1|nr:hypothetical protein [Bacillus cereus]
LYYFKKGDPDEIFPFLIHPVSCCYIFLSRISLLKREHLIDALSTQRIHAICTIEAGYGFMLPHNTTD